MALDSSPNYAQKIITSQSIQENLNLFEGIGIPEWWVKNTKASTLEQSRKDALIRSFPRSRLLRKVTMSLAWSIPMPTICAAEEVDETEDFEDEAMAVVNKKKKEAREKRKEEVDARIKELINRRTWEGELDLMSALPWWRCNSFVTGSTFVKLPTLAENGATVVIPERMPSEYSKLLVDKARIKVISGFEFRYPVGQDGDGFQDDPKGTAEVCERYYPGKWIIVRSPEEPEGKTTDLPWPFIPVAHMQWEQRSLHPRGLPLFEALKDVFLWVLSVKVDRRQAGRFTGNKMFVRKNATGSLPTVKDGAIVDIKDLSPVKKAEFTALEVNTDTASLEAENNDAIRELYETAWLTAPIDEQAGAGQVQSGAAKRVGSKDELKYKTAFILEEGRFLVDLLVKSLTMEGFPVEPKEIRCDYDMSVEPEPAERRADATFYKDSGFDEESLRAMGKEEDELAEMIAERDKRRRESMLSDASLLKDDPTLTAEELAAQAAAEAKLKAKPRVRAED